MARKKHIASDIYDDLIDSTNWGGKGKEYFQSVLEDVLLTAKQQENLIELLRTGISSGYESGVANETITYLKTLKTKN